MEKLPFLVSIPHGGESIPHEIANDVCISPRDLFDDSDSFTRIIYHAEDLVEVEISSDVARSFVDNSRSRDQLPPEFPDGLIKSATCYNRPIYREGRHPTKKVRQLLIDKYYAKYHQNIQEGLTNPNLRIALDCHSMAEIAPEVAPDSGKERPLINLGDAEGSSCDPKVTLLLKESFAEVFQISNEELTINNPFKGGFITRNYGNKPLPWIQIEMNRKLYLSDEYFSYDSLQMKGNRLHVLNLRFRDVLNLFFDKLRQV